MLRLPPMPCTLKYRIVENAVDIRLLDLDFAPIGIEPFGKQQRQ
jgi:hypothetical protein